MQIPNRDGDGYLVDMSEWTPEIGRLMAEADGYELNEKKWEQIMKAREYYRGIRLGAADTQVRQIHR